MAQPRVLILRAPGTNCDRETAFAFERAGGAAQIEHINALLESPRQIAEFQILCIPGGFSYGDDIAAGRIFANQLLSRLQEALAEFREAGKLVLGICNGFQVLLKSGLLVEPANGVTPATLTWNDSGKFEDRWVRLQATASKCVFLEGLEELELPVAHAEGKFVAASSQLLEQLDSSGRLVLRYVARDGSQTAAYPDNPNGSAANVAGVCDASGRMLGLMPHPERHIEFTHHPCWTRRTPRPAGDGLAIFQNAIRYFE